MRRSDKEGLMRGHIVEAKEIRWMHSLPPFVWIPFLLCFPPPRRSGCKYCVVFAIPAAKSGLGTPSRKYFANSSKLTLMSGSCQTPAQRPIGLKGLIGLRGLISALLLGGVLSCATVKVVLTVLLDWVCCNDSLFSPLVSAGFPESFPCCA